MRTNRVCRLCLTVENSYYYLRQKTPFFIPFQLFNHSNRSTWNILFALVDCQLWFSYLSLYLTKRQPRSISNCSHLSNKSSATLTYVGHRRVVGLIQVNVLGLLCCFLICDAVFFTEQFAIRNLVDVNALWMNNIGAPIAAQQIANESTNDAVNVMPVFLVNWDCRLNKFSIHYIGKWCVLFGFFENLFRYQQNQLWLFGAVCWVQLFLIASTRQGLFKNESVVVGHGDSHGPCPRPSGLPLGGFLAYSCP